MATKCGRLKYSSRSKIDYDDTFIRDSIERTHHIAYDRVEDFVPNSEVRLPEFVVPEGKTAIQALTLEALAGMKSKNLDKEEQYIDRLKYELNIIKERGFAQYFLTMKAISDKAQDEMLVGLGRGSAAGSLLAYTLDITQIDPIKYNLQFERFLTAGKTSGIHKRGGAPRKGKYITLVGTDGKELTLSADLELKVEREGRVVLVPASEIKVGEKVV
jgi:DNA polymerase-3 subunit alpha